MNIKEFTVGASHTFSVAPYESVRVEASVTYTVDVAAETKTEMRDSAQKSLRVLLEDTIKAQPHSELRDYLINVQNGARHEQTGRTTPQESTAKRSGG